MPRISIHLAAWNSMRFLPDALLSIEAQTCRDFQIIIVDNASTDGLADYLRERWPEVVLLRNSRNLGFARAHNQAIDLAKSFWEKRVESGERFVLITNPDILLEPDCLERLLAAAEAHPGAGSIGPKLRRAKENTASEIREIIREEKIDSAGLKISRRGRIVERGAGETDRGEYNRGEEVFGISGALCLYRLSALDDAAENGEYFDENFFSYKEDVDLAWRLRLLSWGAWYEPSAVAFHFRGAFGSEKRGLVRAFRERREKSRLVNRLSYRNHFWLMVKNLDFSAFLLYSYRLLPYEIAKLLFLLIFERGTLASLAEALGGAAAVWQKRRALHARRRASAKEIRRWFK
jgi:GT2 family glycosyltransferase